MIGKPTQIYVINRSVIFFFCVSFYKIIKHRKLLSIMMGTIFLKDVLQIMKTKNKDGFLIPFSIKFRTYQRFSKTGGKLKHYEKAKLVMQEGNTNDFNTVDALRVKPKKKTARKKPNHFENKTRNIKVLPSGKIRKINIRYILEFNGKQVIY